MTVKGFLFDLDMTLLDTSKLKPWRDSNNWGSVYKNLDLVRPFMDFGLPSNILPNVLHENGYKIGIVTSSPYNYAAELTKRFGIYYDALVTYSDTKEHKPDPEPLLFALGKLGISASTTCHVGDTSTDMEASYRAGIIPIGAGWSVSSDSDLAGFAPKLFAPAPEVLLHIDDLHGYGYILEELSCKSNLILHPGSTLNWIDRGLSFYALGRYYVQEDGRHKDSILSHNILALKDNHEDPELFAIGLEIFINSILAKMGKMPTMATYVPVWEGKVDRFAPIFEILSKRNRSDIQFMIGGLSPLKATPDYKYLNLGEREMAIKGAFKCNIQWDGIVLLIDDVITTGSTALECAKTLHKFGAKEVIVVTFGRTQYHNYLESKLCPECGKKMKIRTNNQPNSPGYQGRFWACTGWKRDKTGCNHTEKIE